jgi:hypothetical protein
MNDMCIPSYSQSCHELLSWLARLSMQREIKFLLGLCVTQLYAYQTWTEGVYTSLSTRALARALLEIVNSYNYIYLTLSFIYYIFNNCNRFSW